LAGLSSAVLHEITRWREREIEVIVPKQRRAQAGFRIRTCRNLDPRDVTVVNGIPVTTVARTLVDLTDVMDEEELAFVIHEAVYRNRFDLEATLAAMRRANGRRNIKVLERALRIHLSGGSGSGCASRSTGRDTGGRERRSTTGSGMRRCVRPATW
jgi:hypothetical protein